MMKKIFFLMAFVMLNSKSLNAVKVDLGFEIATTTKYENCQGYVDQMIRLWTLLADKEDFFAQHPKIVSQIVDMLKKLNKGFKKCEKSKGKKCFDPTIEIGTTFDFDF